MLRKTLCIIIQVLAIGIAAARAQDVIYTRDSTAIHAKVVLVDVHKIQYQRTDTADSKVHVLYKRKIDYVHYANGIEEQYDHYGNPITNESIVRHARKPNTNYGNNIISVMPVSFTNDNIQTAGSVGLAYERIIDKKARFSIVLPVTVSFYSTLDNEITFNNGTGYSTNTDPLYVFAPGVRFYPTGNRGKTKYAVGASLYTAFGKQDYLQTLYSNGYPSQALVHNKYSLWGLTLNNSLNFFPYKHLYIGIDAGIGLVYYRHNLSDNIGLGGNPTLMQASIRFGYRY